MIPRLFFLCACLGVPLAVAAADQQVLAFPGAEGYGRFASGGRGGAVLAVTHLNDSGPGSLRAAIEAEGPRTVVFRVSGTIELEQPLNIRHGDLTIAGQTAPGGGITLARRGLSIEADNVIIRFIRVRLGDRFPREKGLEHFQEDAFDCRYSTRVMIDHCSFSWGIDETATAYRNKEFTMQWCIVSEALNDSFHEKGSHGFGGIWGGREVSFHHNLIAHHRSRLPRFNGARYGDYAEWGDDAVDFRNNVIYNWGSNNVYGAESHASGFRARYNMIGNVYRPGPATGRSVTARILDPDPNRDGVYSDFRVADNHVFGSEEVTADNWRGVENLPAADRSQEAAPFDFAPVTTFPALVAYDQVLALAGARFPHRDAADARVVAEVRAGTAPHGRNGLIDSPDEVGGYPALQSFPPPADRDGDGLPDAWERARGLDPEDAADGAADPDGDGHTRLEDYLNALVADVR